MSKKKPTHHDASLILELYDLRREAVMRQSRNAIVQWLPKSWDEFIAITQPTHDLNAAWRQVSSYFEMAYGFARHGAVHADMLAESTAEGLILFAKVKPYLERFVVASDGYSPAVTIGFNLQRYVLVFGPASGHARHDDILTDFRTLDGRDILIVRRKAPEPGEYEPYFASVAVRTHEIEGAIFHFVEGRGFRFAAYRDSVLEEARQRWYAVPRWLPAGPCYFCDRYFPDRACHR